MKKIIFAAAIFMGLMCLSCGESKENTSNSEMPTSTVTISPTQAPTKAPTKAPTPVPPKPAYKLTINEVMADNTKLVLGNDNDWIELANDEETTVSLENYYLTDDLDKPHTYPLTGNTIDAGDFLVIELPEEAPFHLNNEGETIYLVYHDDVIDELTYTEEIGKASASKEGVLPFASPGFPNTDEGREDYLNSVILPDIYISEVITSNSKYAPVNGQYYDVLELHNCSEAPVTLNGMYISDKRSELNKYQLPDVTLKADEYFIIYCSGLNAFSNAPFKLSAGETVYLSDGEKLIDLLDIPKDLEKNKSYGRNGNRAVYMEEPTPGEANKTGNVSRVMTPIPDIEPGLYSEAITVTLNGEGTIYYTLDGTRPTTESQVYDKPIVINGVKTIRAFAQLDDRYSDLCAYTYLVGVEHNLPIVSVSLPNSQVASITGNYLQTIEDECILSLYEDNEIKFSVPCGFRLHGNGSRAEAKQNFQLRFRSKYGISKLKYKLFENIDIESFDSLLLKGGSEDYYTANLRDEFLTGLCNGTTNLSVLECKPCILYLGDRFWGVYYLRERFSDEYVADHLKVSKESVDLLYSYGGVQNGSSRDYNALLSFVRSHDMTVEENYQYAMEQIDPISLMDWYICRSYMGDKDVANIRYYRSTEYDSKWRWMYFDLDWAFYHTKDSPISGFIVDNGQNTLMCCLLKNPLFRDMFLKRYAELLNTILNENYICSELDKFVAVIEPEMPNDRERWGLSLNGWYNSITRMHNYVKDGARTDNVLRDIKAYFNLSDEEMKAYFGDNWP